MKMTTLRVFITHWSDNNQNWSDPRWVEQKSANLSLPFGYFLATSLKEAKKKVKLLPKIYDRDKPEWFHLGSLNIEYKSEG